MCNFPAIWDVLSILLNAVDSQLHYAQALQHIYNTHYQMCTPGAMEHLEQQATEIQDTMHYSANNCIFDRASGADDKEAT